MDEKQGPIFVFCGDRGIAKPTAVSIASLVGTSRDPQRLQVVCLTNGWSDEDVRFVRHAAGEASLTLHDVAAAQLPKMNPRALVPPSAFLRFIIPRYIPADRAVYLDSDVLVREDISELTTMDLDGHATGACRASSTPFIGSPRSVEGWRELGLNPRGHALNSGVLVMDLVGWRSEGIGERAMALASERGESFRLADQAVLNAVLNGRWKELHPRWNATTGVFEDDKGWYAVETPERLEEAASDPSIVHFTGGRKPWKPGVRRPFVDDWQRIASGLGWEPWDQRRPLRQRARNLFANMRRRLA